MSFNDVYKKMLLNRGGSVTDSDIRNSKSSIDRKFKDDPSYKLATLRVKDATIKDADLDTRVVNVDTNTKKKKIYVRPDTKIEVGDYIIYPDKTYLVLEVEDNLISPYASVEECNYISKWMYRGILYTTNSILANQTKYTLGTEVLSVGITEGSSRFQKIMPYNKKTKTILEGQRMIFNNKAWKVTQVDFVSDVGLMNVLFGQTAINYEIDDIDNEIAGAFESKHTYIWNLPTSFEVAQNGEYILPYSIVDETGKEIDYNLVTVSTSDSTFISINKSDKTITIKGLSVGTGTIKIDIPVGETVEEKIVNFEVKSVPVNQINYTCEWSSTGTTLKTYVASTAQCTKYINGTKQDGLVISYEIDSVAQSLVNTSKIAITQSTNSSVQIRNKSVSSKTTFTIIIKDSSDGTVITNQVITLTGM